MENRKTTPNIFPASRLEAFTDGVLAVIITLMVLELRAPEGAELGALRTLIPSFLIYALSFHTIATYWNNHHHLFAVTKRIEPKVMWLNMNLLFWLSLIPFFTAWLGEHYTKAQPTACYAALLLIAGISFQLLEFVILKINNIKRRASLLGFGSLIAYACAIPLAFVHPYIADGIILLVTLVWFMPGRAFNMGRKVQS